MLLRYFLHCSAYPHIGLPYTMALSLNGPNKLCWSPTRNNTRSVSYSRHRAYLQLEFWNIGRYPFSWVIEASPGWNLSPQAATFVTEKQLHSGSQRNNTIGPKLIHPLSDCLCICCLGTKDHRLTMTYLKQLNCRTGIKRSVKPIGQVKLRLDLDCIIQCTCTMCNLLPIQTY